MDATEALTRLRANESALRVLGIEQLALFGSTARGEQRERSDIDLAARLDPRRRIGLLELVRIEQTIGNLLGARVDLVTEPAAAPMLQAQIDRDRVRVF